MAARLRMDVRRQAHQARLEDAGVHRLELGRHGRLETHLRDHVTLRIKARRDLNELEPSLPHTKHGAFCDEERDLVAAATDAGAVTDLLELGDELPMRALCPDHRLSVLPRNVESTCSQR